MSSGANSPMFSWHASRTAGRVWNTRTGTERKRF